jgi:HAE1 family hydrophobic/amphiphilic exporter-1
VLNRDIDAAAADVQAAIARREDAAAGMTSPPSYRKSIRPMRRSF